jgi:hypothetical protein
VLDRLGPDVDQFAVGEIAKQQVIQQLRSMPAGQLFNSFELEDRALGNQHVQKIRLAKGAERDVNRLLQ